MRNIDIGARVSMDRQMVSFCSIDKDVDRGGAYKNGRVSVVYRRTWWVLARFSSN